MAPENRLLARRVGPIVVAARGVRPALPTDAETLAAIDAGVSINHWSVRQFAAACSDTDGQREATLVIEQDGRVVGFVVFSQVLDEASVHNIAVHAADQGQGLGKELLQAALAQMARAGAVRCLLEVRQSNTAARRLYEGNGFELDGVRKHYYPGPDGREDALMMSRKL